MWGPLSEVGPEPVYEPFDQEARLGPPPWKHTPELSAWMRAHGHDVRLKCYPEFGCQVIEPALERRIAKLEAELSAAMQVIDKLTFALRKIANQDYRGNEPLDRAIARAALKALKEVDG
jgi:hypothetical protein